MLSKKYSRPRGMGTTSTFCSHTGYIHNGRKANNLARYAFPNDELTPVNNSFSNSR